LGENALKYYARSVLSVDPLLRMVAAAERYVNSQLSYEVSIAGDEMYRVITRAVTSHNAGMLLMPMLRKPDSHELLDNEQETAEYLAHVVAKASAVTGLYLDGESTPKPQAANVMAVYQRGSGVMGKDVLNVVRMMTMHKAVNVTLLVTQDDHAYSFQAAVPDDGDLDNVVKAGAEKNQIKMEECKDSIAERIMKDELCDLLVVGFSGDLNLKELTVQSLLGPLVGALLDLKSRVPMLVLHRGMDQHMQDGVMPSFMKSKMQVVDTEKGVRLESVVESARPSAASNV